MNFTPYELVFGRQARTQLPPPQKKLETYGVYLRDLITRLIDLRKSLQKTL